MKTTKVHCIKVKKENAEKERRKLVFKGLLNLDYSPKSEGDFVYFSITKEIPGSIESDFKPTKRKPITVTAVLKEMNIPVESITKSFDIFGDIALISIPKGIKGKDKEKKIAEAVMKVHPNIKVVAKKTGPISGEYRIRKLKVIGGEKRTETIHKESGCIFHVDIAKAYFSPRLSYERKRISSLVKSKENVFVPFAGVGPFAIVIAKEHPDAKIYANELNPNAFKYMEENIRLNYTPNVQAYPGDAREFAKKFVGKADRVVMPIPMSADKFLDTAFLLAKKGAVVHLYIFEKSEKNAIDVITKYTDKIKRKIKIISTRIAREYSPQIIEVVVDFQIL